MDGTLIWILVAVFGLIGVITYARGQKVWGFSKHVVGVSAFALALVLVLMQTGTLAEWGITALSPLAVSSSTTPAPTNQVGSLCAVEDTTVTLSAQDKYLSTAVGGSHRYRINGASASTVADGGTFTASPGDSLEIMYYNGSLDGTGYYSKVVKTTVPCKGTFTPTENNEPMTLSKNGSLTARIWNTNGVVIDGSATNQTMSAGDSKNLKMEIEGQNQRDTLFYGAVLVVEFNKTSLDDAIISIGGVELSSASVPQSYSATYGSDSVKKAYEFPSLMGIDLKTLSVTLDADDTIDPEVGGGDVILKFYPKNYYIDDKKGGSYEGPSAEDEYNVVTKPVTYTTTVHVQ